MSFQIELLIDPQIKDGDYLLEYVETNIRNNIIQIDDLNTGEMSLVGLNFNLTADDLEFLDPAFDDPENPKRFVQLPSNFVPFQLRDRRNFPYGEGETVGETRRRAQEIKKFLSRIRGQFVLLIVSDSQNIRYATPVKTVLTGFFGKEALDKLPLEGTLVILSQKPPPNSRETNKLRVLTSKENSRVRWLVQTSSRFINVERWNANFRFKTSEEIKTQMSNLFVNLENLIGRGSAFRDIVDKLGHHVGENRKLDGTNQPDDVQLPWYTSYPEDLEGDSELVRGNLDITAKAAQAMAIDQLEQKRRKIIRQPFLSKRAHTLLTEYIQLYEQIKRDLVRKLDLDVKL